MTLSELPDTVSEKEVFEPQTSASNISGTATPLRHSLLKPISLIFAVCAILTMGAPLGALAQNISTAAGTGTAGYSGDGGLATNAEINYPGGVAVELNGDVYIADTSNCVIRKISVSGYIVFIRASTYFSVLTRFV